MKIQLKVKLALFALCCCFLSFSHLASAESLPLFYYKEKNLNNFGDYLSLKIVERMTGHPVRVFNPKKQEKKLLAIGSIFYFATTGDVVWGSGINGKTLKKSDYRFTSLDVRSVRGPLSRNFLKKNFRIECPQVFGDPALLFPYLFPEFTKSETPELEYLVIPHYRDIKLYPKEIYKNVVYPTDPWEEIISKILNSRLVISSSLHGIILAEAYGIPARMLQFPKGEFLFKYLDYYLGTGRRDCTFASSIEEAIEMGGETPFDCDLKLLYDAFPFDYFPGSKINHLF